MVNNRRVAISGRRRGSPDTAGEILDAAREAFAAHGFDRTTIRAVANRAEVDPALVLHYFGTKDALFTASLELPFDPEEFERIVGDERSGVGTRVARFYLSLWESPTTGPVLVAALRSAATHPEAGARLREFISTQILRRLRRHVAADRPELRATLAGSHLIGTALARYVVAVEPLAQVPLDTVAAAIGPQLDRYLFGEMTWDAEMP